MEFHIPYAATTAAAAATADHTAVAQKGMQH
jgi:hypothetical protein